MYDEWKRKAHPNQYKKEQQEQDRLMKEFLQSLDIEVEGESEFEQPARKKAPPPPPKRQAPLKSKQKQTTHRNLKGDFEFHSNLDDYSKKNVIENREFKTNIVDKFAEGYGDKLVSKGLRSSQSVSRPYKQKIERKRSRAKKLISSLDTKKDMVLLKEIFGPPKSLQ